MAAFQMVHDAPGRADHNVRAVFQAGVLSAQGHATAQRDDLDIFFSPRQTADLLRHLVSQLARRAQHHRLHRKTPRIQVGQQSQRKSGGFATAGLGLRNQVFAQQGNRQTGRLNRRHLGVTEQLEVGQSGRRQGQAGEIEGGGGGSHRWIIGLGCLKTSPNSAKVCLKAFQSKGFHDSF